ncbi:hypothetical protein DXV75_07905 [Alteromonas aestuariivivens]|uniref:DNA repair protein n=1 Tax=Alteromonas aestuariivivens TaxID=1938339 RepID=A0A3D8M804_9ALTE|nr:hypothetical protein [Alteromonas aestuariivivens]RDV26001.1 hypothetical protein DXV75_07905 [Alteromonas aestuariivivens]
MFTTIIILIVVLVIAAIFINAFQQHRSKIEAEKRAEVAKQRSIIDETENVLMACGHMPVTPRLIKILHRRIYNALLIAKEVSPKSTDLKQRMEDAKQLAESADDSPPPIIEFSLPDNDKLIIQYIQAVKKLRVLLRSEHSKGKIDTKTYVEEDKMLERLQLRINVETLIRRGRSALQAGMLGSARQYFEKASTALESQSQPDEYVKARLLNVQEWLEAIQDNLKNANAEDRARKRALERDELDELFAPKKKW